MEGSNKSDYSASFTDLMASLSVVFLILAGGVTILLSMRSKKKIDDIPKQSPTGAIEAHTAKLASEISKLIPHDTDDNKLIIHGNTVRVIFGSRDNKRNSLYFPLNDYRLGSEQAKFVTTTVREIVSTACRLKETDKTKINLIVLEGHTDSSANPKGEGCHSDSNLTGVEQSFCNNVRLSSLRATETFFHLRGAIRENSDLSTCINEHFLVSGRGSASPVDRIFEQAGIVSDSDRRVELVFHIVPIMRSESR